MAGGLKCQEHETVSIMMIINHTSCPHDGYTYLPFIPNQTLVCILQINILQIAISVYVCPAVSSLVSPWQVFQQIFCNWSDINVIQINRVYVSVLFAISSRSKQFNTTLIITNFCPVGTNLWCVFYRNWSNKGKS